MEKKIHIVVPEQKLEQLDWKGSGWGVRQMEQSECLAKRGKYQVPSAKEITIQDTEAGSRPVTGNDRSPGFDENGH